MTPFETWVLSNVATVIPFLLLVAGLVLKMVVDREVTLPIFLQAIIELPVDMKFLAIGFFASFAIAPNGDATLGMTLVFIFLLSSILTTLVSRRSYNAFAGSNHGVWVFLTAGNFFVSFLILSYGIAKVENLLP